MSIKTRLEADVEREYQNVEYLLKERPGLAGLAAFPSSVFQVPGKYLFFSETKVSEKCAVDPENVVLTWTRLKNFLVERG